MKAVAVIGVLLVVLLDHASAGTNVFQTAKMQGDDHDHEEEHWVFHSRHENETNVTSPLFAKLQEFPRFGDPSNNNRDLPYFKQGRQIYIYGSTSRRFRGSFDIDLIPVYDNTYGSDAICLRITVDLNSYHIYRDSYIHGKWQYREGEQETYGGINPGRFFVISIVVQHHAYQIAIDGYHFATFYHRIPFVKDMRISVTESIPLDYIEYY